MNKHIKKQLIERDKRLYYDFLPAMEEIIEKPANKITSIILYTCFALILSTIIWACLFKLDITVTATGNIDTVGAMVAPVYMTNGVIDEIAVNDGDYVDAGTVICRLDPSQNELALKDYENNLNLLYVQKEIYEILYDMYKSGELHSLDIEASAYGSDEKIVEAIILENDMFIYDLKEMNEKDIVRALDNRLYYVTTNISTIDSQIESIILQIERLMNDMKNMNVTAIVSGYITFSEKMYIGKTVKIGDTVCYINENEMEYVFTAYIADEDIASIDVGDKVSIKIQAYDETENEYIEGTVMSVGNMPLSIKEKGTTYVVKITPEIIPKDLKPGMEGIIDIIIGTRSVMDYFLEPFVNAQISD